jgi:hypothetical protein
MHTRSSTTLGIPEHSSLYHQYLHVRKYHVVRMYFSAALPHYAPKSWYFLDAMRCSYASRIVVGIPANGLPSLEKDLMAIGLRTLRLLAKYTAERSKLLLNVQA